MFNKSFFKVFLWPEFLAIVSKWSRIVSLLVVVAISLWSIGFSQASSKILQERMNSPFIKFLTVTLPYNWLNENDNLDRLMRHLSDTLVQNRFEFRDPQLQTRGSVFFAGQEKGTFEYGRIKPINPKSNLFKYLFENEEIMLTERMVNFKDNPYAVIVTQSYLEDLGYASDSWPTFIRFIPSVKNLQEHVNIPITAVVKSLPNRANVFTTEKMYKLLLDKYHYSAFDKNLSERKQRKRWYISEFSDQSLLKKRLEELRINYHVVAAEDTWKKGSYIDFVLTTDSVNQNEYDFKISASLSELGLIESFNYRLLSFNDAASLTPDELQLNFSDIGSVKPFSEHLKEGYGLETELSDIEAMKNFQFFQLISAVLSTILVLFSMLMLVFTLSRAIIEHIEKNAQSIGTLKAFGLSNLVIMQVYGFISLLLIILIFMSGMLINFSSGHLVSAMVLGSIQDLLNNEPKLFILPFDLSVILYFIVFPFLGVQMKLFLTLRKKTPGDLIYDR